MKWPQVPVISALDYSSSSQNVTHLILFFRSLDRHDSFEMISAPVIENPEHQTLWYSKYFLGKFHHNYVGQDCEKSTYVLSVVEEKSFGKAHCRCILWTKDGPKRLVVPGAQKSRSPKTILGQFGLSAETPPKEVCVPFIYST